MHDNNRDTSIESVPGIILTENESPLEYQHLETDIILVKKALTRFASAKMALEAFVRGGMLDCLLKCWLWIVS